MEREDEKMDEIKIGDMIYVRGIIKSPNGVYDRGVWAVEAQISEVLPDGNYRVVTTDAFGDPPNNVFTVKPVVHWVKCPEKSEDEYEKMRELRLDRMREQAFDEDGWNDG